MFTIKILIVLNGCLANSGIGTTTGGGGGGGGLVEQT